MKKQRRREMLYRKALSNWKLVHVNMQLLNTFPVINLPFLFPSLPFLPTFPLSRSPSIIWPFACFYALQYSITLLALRCLVRLQCRLKLRDLDSCGLQTSDDIILRQKQTGEVFFVCFGSAKPINNHTKVLNSLQTDFQLPSGVHLQLQR